MVIDWRVRDSRGTGLLNFFGWFWSSNFEAGRRLDFFFWTGFSHILRRFSRVSVERKFHCDFFSSKCLIFYNISETEK